MADKKSEALFASGLVSAGCILLYIHAHLQLVHIDNQSDFAVNRQTLHTSNSPSDCTQVCGRMAVIATRAAGSTPSQFLPTP